MGIYYGTEIAHAKAVADANWKGIMTVTDSMSDPIRYVGGSGGSYIWDASPYVIDTPEEPPILNEWECKYCGSTNDELQCQGCGAPKMKAKKSPTEIGKPVIRYSGYDEHKE